MSQDPASQPSPIPEAQKAKSRLAKTFGAPPPEPHLRNLTDEDKAAVARVAQTTTPTGQQAGEIDEQIMSASAELRAMTSDLRETDPEAAQVIEQQAESLELIG